MPKTIVIASGKGGVGKSTTTAVLGKFFAEKGNKVLLVDCDAGLASLDMILDVRENSVFSWYDAYTGNCSVDEALIKINSNLYLLTAPTEGIEDSSDSIISDICESLTENFDVIIRDAPAGVGTGLRRAAKNADTAIVVTTGDEVSVKAASSVGTILEKLGIKNVRLLINRYEIKPAKKGKLLNVDELIDKSFIRLIGIVPDDKDLTYLTVTNRIKTKSKSLAAYRRITDRISGKNVYLDLSLLK